MCSEGENSKEFSLFSFQKGEYLMEDYKKKIIESLEEKGYDVTQPNSHKYKEEQKQKEKELTTKKPIKVKVKQKSKTDKAIGKFISPEAHNVGNYIIDELVIPTLKKTVVDAITNSAQMIFLGKIVGTSKSRDRYDDAPYVSYRDYSRRDRDRDVIRMSSRNFGLDDFIFETEQDAEDVIGLMCEALDEYKVVSVSDLYDILRKDCPRTYANYGWTNLRSARSVRTRDGYILDLPKPYPI